MAISTRMWRSPVTRSCPVSFDRGSPFELEAQLGEKRDGGIEGFHHDANVVHSLDRHRRPAFPTGWNSRRTALEGNITSGRARSSVIEHRATRSTVVESSFHG